MYEDIFASIKDYAARRNLKESTADSYCHTIRYFMDTIEKVSLEELTIADAENFLFEKRLSGIKPETYNFYYSGLRFLYKRILKQNWDEDDIPRMKRDRPLPVVLSKEEINAILDATPNLKHKAILATMYSAGLRVSEVVHLHYDDISRSHHWIHVRNSKNRTDRYTILADRTLNLLTEYWFAFEKPRNILFPSSYSGGYIEINTVNQFLKASAKKAGIRKNISSHSLRHSFASHLLESGCDIKYIQTLLGHMDPKSTEIYLHVSDKTLLGIRSPFDLPEVGHE